MRIKTAAVEKQFSTKELRKLLPTFFLLQSQHEMKEVGSAIIARKKALREGLKLSVRAGRWIRKPDVGDEFSVYLEPGDAQVGEFHTHPIDYSGELFWGTPNDYPSMSAGDFCDMVEAPDSVQCVAGYVDCRGKKCPTVKCYHLRMKSGRLPKLTVNVQKKVCVKGDLKNENIYYKNEKKIWRTVLSETRKD